MNDATRSTRATDLAALAMAADANGRVDLTAFEAQRLILSNQTIQGVDAQGLVRSITSSPTYADSQGREQVGKVVDAIISRLPVEDAKRFSAALDAANVNESWAERTFERYIEEPVSAGWNEAKAMGSQALNWTDTQISDNLAASRRWAQGIQNNPQNSYLERAAGTLASDMAGQGQDSYGSMKGATSHGLSMLGETVDLAKFAHQFSTDGDFRNLVMGAAAVYAGQAYEDPGKVPRDIRNAAVGAWNEWEKGYEQALSQGKEQEYLGEAKGAAAIEIIATFVPTSKLTKLGKAAEVAIGAEDLAPAAGRIAGHGERRVAGGLSEELVELVNDARQLQAKGGMSGQSADLFFSGLAGVKRSQGELGELVEGMRKAGHLDGLLGSGALSPKELGYLARQDFKMFEGQVSFEQAVTKSVGDRDLAALKTGETGDIGEALVSHKLAREGYTDLVPIQNNSGHGNDLVGHPPGSNTWEVIEVKASVKGLAKNQTGNPEPIIESRLQKAVDGLAYWKPENMWEEQAANTARRILRDAQDIETGELKIDAKWARVNLERDASGLIKGEPKIDPWLSPEQRALERNAPEAPAVTPHSPAHPDHAMLNQIHGKVSEIGKQAGVPEQINLQTSASLLALAKESGMTRVDHVALSTRTDGLEAARNIFIVQGNPSDPAALRAHMSTAQAAQAPVEQSFAQLEQASQRLAQTQQQTMDQVQSQGGPQIRMT